MGPGAFALAESSGLNQNHAGPTNESGTDSISLTFYGTEPIPEPSSAMLIGLSALALLARRRRPLTSHSRRMQSTDATSYDRFEFPLRMSQNVLGMHMSKWMNRLRWALAGLAGGCAGANQPESSIPPSPAEVRPPVASRPAAASEPAASRPFVIPEASLPAGFPPPGEVGVIAVKHYPAFREARVQASDAGKDDMFMTLFDHIKSNDISMTAPVEITWNQPTTQPAEPVAMAFLYKNNGIGKTGTDGKVTVVDMPAETVISIAVRGGYGPGNFSAAVSKLRDFLAAHSDQYKQNGAPRYLAYNSPFVPPFLRFGEVQIPVTPR